MKYLLLTLTLLSISCGKDDSSSSEDNLPMTPDVSFAMAITEDELPECTETNQHQLVYLTDSLEFMTCKELVWIAIPFNNQDDTEQDDTEEMSSITTISEPEGDNCEFGGVGITDTLGDTSYVCNGSDGQDGVDGSDGQDGLEIEAVWSWTTDTYVDEDNLATEGSTTSVKISEIVVTQFANGTLHLNTVGIAAYDVQLYFDFSHTSWLVGEDLTIPQTRTHKIMPYANSLISYEVVFNDGVPTVKSTVSLDGDFDNNTYISYPLTLGINTI